MNPRQHDPTPIGRHVNYVVGHILNGTLGDAEAFERRSRRRPSPTAAAQPTTAPAEFTPGRLHTEAQHEQLRRKAAAMVAAARRERAIREFDQVFPAAPARTSASGAAA
jgi:hypothetical protein